MFGVFLSVSWRIVDVGWKVSAVSENHDGGTACRHSSALNEPDCHFMANLYFVSQGTGVERGGEQDNTNQGRSHSGSSATVPGEREKSRPRGQGWRQPKSR